MLTVLMVRESMSATGYIPSTFQEEKGDFPNKPRNGPFQRTGILYMHNGDNKRCYFLYVFDNYN